MSVVLCVVAGLIFIGLGVMSYFGGYKKRCQEAKEMEQLRINRSGPRPTVAEHDNACIAAAFEMLITILLTGCGAILIIVSCVCKVHHS